MKGLSRSTSQTSSGNLMLRFLSRNAVGTPIINGVGAKSNCSDPVIDKGKRGIIGKTYSKGYNILM